MVVPAARVFLRVAFMALTSTILGLLCLTVVGVPRGLASGRLPRAAQRVPAGPGSGRLRCELPGEPRDFCCKTLRGMTVTGQTHRRWHDVKPRCHSGRKEKAKDCWLGSSYQRSCLLSWNGRKRAGKRGKPRGTASTARALAAIVWAMCISRFKWPLLLEQGGVDVRLLRTLVPREAKS
ncbi:protein CEI [Molossus molossus]|uniref:protein CEI n=1 Tax=Molossus molossus TaxID=27622 RepID=UPI001747B882|nr:protein CEI [Molossus molossus]